MKTTVKTFWICMLLMLICNISGRVIDPVQVDDRMSGVAEVSASLSSWFAWTTDIEPGIKPVPETYSSHQQRLRRAIESNLLLLRNMLLMLSDRENLLVQDRFKLYYSDKAYTLTGSDYYIYALRRILI